MMRRAGIAVGVLLLASGAGNAIAGTRPEPALDCRAFNDAKARQECTFANAGDPKAQIAVGLSYSLGQGVPIDTATAIRLFGLAASQGELTADAYLGSMYASGRGVPEDDREAVRLFRLAADKGNALAEVNLADMYASGRGMARNNAEALDLYRRAAVQGNVLGMNGTAWRLTIDGGDLNEAMDWAGRAAALEPQNAAIQDTIAWILFRQRKFELALFHAERSVALEPRCASCEDHLGDILAALGRREDARAHWQRAVDMSSQGSSDPDWDRNAVAKKLAIK
jgi:uncharacterized protein